MKTQQRVADATAVSTRLGSASAAEEHPLLPTPNRGNAVSSMSSAAVEEPPQSLLARIRALDASQLAPNYVGFIVGGLCVGQVESSLVKMLLECRDTNNASIFVVRHGSNNVISLRLQIDEQLLNDASDETVSARSDIFEIVVAFLIERKVIKK